MNKIILLLCFIFMINTAYATVSISSEYYNSESHVHERIVVSNAKYVDKTLVVPFSGFRGVDSSITSIGFAKSTDKKFEIYYSLAIDGKDVEFGLKSDNGNFKFNKKYAQNCLNAVNAEFSSDSYLKDKFANKNFEIRDEVSNKNTTYYGKVTITDNKIAAFGTCTPKDGVRGFSIVTKVKSHEKDTTTYAKLEEKSLNDNAYFECKNKIETTGKNGTIDKLIKIEANEGYGISIGGNGEIEAFLRFEDMDKTIPEQCIPPNGKLDAAIVPLEANIKQEIYLKMTVELWK